MLEFQENINELFTLFNQGKIPLSTFIQLLQSELDFVKTHILKT